MTQDGAGKAPASLEGAPLDLTPQERARLLGEYGHAFVAGEMLFGEGDPAKEAYLLLEGRVRLLRRVRATEKSIGLLRPGHLVGEAALLDDAPRTHTAIALTEGTALALHPAAFRKVLYDHPALTGRLVEQLVRRVRESEDRIDILMLHGTQSKIVSALLKLARPGEAGAAELAVSPAELSTRVGLDVDTVRRAVQRLRDQSYLKITGERVEIPDVDALRRLSI